MVPIVIHFWNLNLNISWKLGKLWKYYKNSKSSRNLENLQKNFLYCIKKWNQPKSFRILVKSFVSLIRPTKTTMPKWHPFFFNRFIRIWLYIFWVKLIVFHVEGLGGIPWGFGSLRSPVQTQPRAGFFSKNEFPNSWGVKD